MIADTGGKPNGGSTASVIEMKSMTQIERDGGLTYNDSIFRGKIMGSKSLRVTRSLLTYNHLIFRGQIMGSKSSNVT
jgi:hypothetical protein